MIYIIPNLLTNTTSYVVPDLATETDGQAKGYVGNYVVGTEAEANNLLAISQQDCLSLPNAIFTVNLSVVVPDGTQWTIVDLNTEPDNTDRVYFVFDPTLGTSTQAIGLSNAKELLSQIHQSFIDFCLLSSYSTWDSFPVKPKPTIMGTQTL